jgi:TnpA family transposase
LRLRDLSSWGGSSPSYSRLGGKALTCGIQEYGRLNKTIFILRYLLTEQVQRRIGAQTNKGEALHTLRGFLFLANEGRIRRRIMKSS